MYRFPPRSPPKSSPESKSVDVYDEIKWGFRVEGDHPLLDDESELYTDAEKMWYDETNKVIIELVKR
jgi:hypothetical protein